MQTHTTNYTNTFIAIASDCPATNGEKPPANGEAKTIAGLQYDMLINHPYKYTSDDVLFMVFAQKKDLLKSEYEKAQVQFFSKGQPCFRASPLTKRYGWGVHNDSEGKIAIFGCETVDYQNLLTDKSLTVIKAMKSNK